MLTGEMIVTAIAGIVLTGIIWFSDYGEKKQVRYWRQVRNNAEIIGDDEIAEVCDRIIIRHNSRR